MERTMKNNSITAVTTASQQYATHHHATSPRAAQHRGTAAHTAKRRVKSALLLCSLALLSTTFTACYDYEDELLTPREVGDSQTQLAFALGQFSTNTRMSDAAVQELDNNLATFRGISELYLIPFATGSDLTANPISEGMTRIGTEVLTPRSIASGNTELNSQIYNYSNYYIGVTVPYHTSAFLCYGIAPSADAKTEGRIVPNNIRANQPKDISFSLQPIYEGAASDVPEKAQLLVDYLNSIYHGGTENWSATDAATKWAGTLLKDARDSVFATGVYSAGSSANVLAMVKRLYAALYFGRSNTDVAAVLTAILARTNKASLSLEAAKPEGITALSYDLSGYPADINLPDGAAYIEWTGDQYKVVKDKSNLSALSVYSINDIVYPPSLAYFANSRVMTHEKKLEGTIDQVGPQLNSIFKNSLAWGSESNYTATALGANHSTPAPNNEYVLDQKDPSDATKFLFTGRSVTPETGIVAIAKPLQYAVARLDVQLKVSDGQTEGDVVLTDAAEEPNQITVTANSFPVTGILIAGQKDVNWQFNTAATTSDSKTYTIYDSQVKASATASEPTLPANRTSTSAIIRTLAFETYPNDPVYVAVEFVNNSGVDFVTGPNKRIVPQDCKFYLIGQLDPSTVTGDALHGNTHGKVLCQDQVTTVTFTVKDLKNAYNVIPDFSADQLEFSLGVTDWKFSTPAGTALE